VSREREEQSLPRSRIYIDLGELSSKQRGAVLGLLKDMDFAPGEISEVVIQIPEEPVEEPRRGKRK
jgi:hypothetical protein